MSDDEEWVECWNCCGSGFVDHDCGEDVCCCLYPEENVWCEVCDGQGGWFPPDSNDEEESIQ